MQLTSGYLLITVVASFLLLNIFVIVKWQKLQHLAIRILAIILINLSGRGDKDVQTAAQYFGIPL